MTRAVMLILGLMLAAGTAGAQTLQPAPDRLLPSRAAVDLRVPSAAISKRDALADAVRIPGVSKTAVDHRFDDDAVGSLGFLCGLKPGEKYGAGAMRGYDQTGRFVGAKFSLAFR